MLGLGLQHQLAIFHLVEQDPALVRIELRILGRVLQRLAEQLERAVTAFSETPDVTADLAESLVAQGFLSFDDLSVIEPDQLAEMGGLTEEQCDAIVAYAEKESERLELEQKQRRAQEKAQEHDKFDQERRKPAEKPKLAPEPTNGAAGSHGEPKVADTDVVGASGDHDAEHQPAP